MVFWKKNSLEKDDLNLVNKSVVDDDKKGLMTHNYSVTLDKIEKGVEETGFAIENLINNIEYISKGVGKQMSSIGNVVAQIENYSALAEEVSASTTHSQNISENTLSVAQNGNIAVENSLRAMDEITKSVEYTKKVVSELSTQASNINKMLSMIKNISDATNLLALNAAIEAARAGEYGRGFGVVADEVRKLANESSNAVKQISEIIDIIEGSIKETLKAMDESSIKVQNGVSIAKDTNRAFNEIIKSVETATSVSEEIASAITEQTSSLQEVVNSTEDLKKVSQTVMSMVEIMTMNTQHTQSSIGLLSKATKNLNIISETLIEDKKNADKLQKKYILRTAINNEISGLDPMMVIDSETVRILNNIHTGLLRSGLSTEVLPGIAKSWYIKEDNKTWVFNLRKNVRFHNGREIKASDVKHSLERLLSSSLKSPNAWFLMEVQGAKDYNNGKKNEVIGIKVLNDYMVSITLDMPYSGFLLNLAQTCCAILPMEDVNEGKFTGCGPYIMRDMSNGKYILGAYKDYFNGLPYVDRIEVDYETKNMVEGFIENKYDFLVINNSDVKEMMKTQQGKLVKTVDILTTNFAGFNLKRNTIFAKSREVRRAMNHAINRQRIIDEVVNGLALESKGVFPPAIVDNYYLKGFDYSPQTAISILNKSDYDGEELIILGRDKSVGIFDTNEKTIEYIKEDLNAIGIKSRVLRVPSKKYMNAQSISKCDLFMMGWVADTGDPDNYLQPLFNPDNYTNFCGYNNVAVTKMMQEAKMIVNPEKRVEAYKKIQELIISDYPWIFLYHSKTPYIHRDGIINVNLSSLGKIKYDDIILKENQGDGSYGCEISKKCYNK